MTNLNPMIVIVTFFFIMVVSILLLEDRKKKKNKEKVEGVEFFGEKITTQDYFSFCNTCIAYLLISQEKKLDLTTFISEKKLEDNKGKESMRMLEQTINLFPIISCTWDGGTVFSIDETKTIEKLEIYQKNTQNDDYIIPLFDVGLVSRNPKLFNTATRYQQAKTAEKVLTTRGVGDMFQGTEEIVQGLDDLSVKGSDYVVPQVYYSSRNIDYSDNGINVVKG